MGKMKIKAKLEGDIVKANVMIKHPMLTYNAAKKKGKEANFITYIVGKVGDKIVYEASTSQFLSENPLLRFKFKGAKKGDKLTITWRDLKGKTVTKSKKIK
ncbi:MAG: thiosulfate oxidation carrier complex protein SoxZ [Epsilonproteobacteria bacterium]|nr:thiosulfate oxidation carrier complex protein SoxZ [Campylobacterota bacterium]